MQCKLIADCEVLCIKAWVMVSEWWLQL